MTPGISIGQMAVQEEFKCFAHQLPGFLGTICILVLQFRKPRKVNPARA